MASASPARDYDDQDEDEPSSVPSDSADLTPAINCEVAGENGMYGQFTWTVALPAAPADKDSLADISKIRQFRLQFPKQPWAIHAHCVGYYADVVYDGQHSVAASRALCC